MNPSRHPIPLALALMTAWLATTACGGISRDQRRLAVAQATLEATHDLAVTWSEDAQRDIYRRILSHGGSVGEAQAAVAAFREARMQFAIVLLDAYKALREASKGDAGWSSVEAAMLRVDAVFDELRARAKE